jgi:hypothetical protein
MDLSRPAVIELQHQEIVPCSATVKLGANQATLQIISSSSSGVNNGINSSSHILVVTDCQ